MEGSEGKFFERGWRMGGCRGEAEDVLRKFQVQHPSHPPFKKPRSIGYLIGKRIFFYNFFCFFIFYLGWRGGYTKRNSFKSYILSHPPVLTNSEISYRWRAPLPGGGGGAAISFPPPFIQRLTFVKDCTPRRENY